ncbi:ABC transporter permease [Mesorhizobium sp.]|uniref:ABC transporter permease n=1 Tax=Mesorhizobium sp. TaxID=1871066 RepID=UPI000FE55419|nr:ABC transporter permease [Mesorhizobium sp.]RWN33417.1 MAG: ABC transporter permease [Mesorhizobium sp.]
MSAILGFFLTNPTLVAIMASVVGAITWGFHQRLAGAKAERHKQQVEELAARDISDGIQNDVGALPAAKARDELAKWGKP